MKVWVGRNWTGIDTVIDSAINASIELFGHTIAAIYDEQRWTHTFSSGDTSADRDNFELPATTKHIITASVVDPDSTEDVYHELDIISPAEVYNLDAYFANRPGYDTNALDLGVSGIMSFSTFDKGYRGGRTRVDREGVPRLIWRVGTNCFIHPRNSSNEEGWRLELLLAVRPAELSLDADTNTITEHYPRALAHYAAGIVWGARLADMPRAQSEFAIAGQLLSQIAHENEISKLINIPIRRV